MSQDNLTIATAIAVGVAVGRWISGVTHRRGSNGDADAAAGDAAVSRPQGAARTQPEQSGTAQEKPTKAWLLVISSKFRSEADRDAFVGHVKRVAQQSACHEPRTLGFQVGIADSDPLRILILERFASKEDWSGAHRSSAAFKELKAWQAGSGIQVETQGQSYDETDVGYLTEGERGYVIAHTGRDILDGTP